MLSCSTSSRSHEVEHFFMHTTLPKSHNSTKQPPTQRRRGSLVSSCYPATEDHDARCTMMNSKTLHSDSTHATPPASQRELERQEQGDHIGAVSAGGAVIRIIGGRGHAAGRKKRPVFSSSSLMTLPSNNPCSMISCSVPLVNITQNHDAMEIDEEMFSHRGTTIGDISSSSSFVMYHEQPSRGLRNSHAVLQIIDSALEVIDESLASFDY